MFDERCIAGALLLFVFVVLKAVADIERRERRRQADWFVGAIVSAVYSEETGGGMQPLFIETPPEQGREI